MHRNGPALPGVTAGGYPTPARALAGVAHDPPDAAFEYGLGLTVAGLEARRGGGTTPAPRTASARRE